MTVESLDMMDCMNKNSEPITRAYENYILNHFAPELQYLITARCCTVYAPDCIYVLRQNDVPFCLYGRVDLFKGEKSG